MGNPPWMAPTSPAKGKKVVERTRHSCECHICHADAMAGYLSNQGTRLFDRSRCRPLAGDDRRAYAEHLGPWRKFVSPRCPAGDMCVASQREAWRMTLHLGTRSEGDLSAIRRRWLRLALRRWPHTRTLRSSTTSSRESSTESTRPG